MAEGKHAIIVGASSGMGAELARVLARRGWKLALVARREKELEELARELNAKVKQRALAFPHDVTDYEEVPALFQKITKELGGFDMIVYSSGVMPSVAIDEYNFEKDRRMVEVNVLGAVAWLNQAAIRCERQKSGTIAGIGSVAGDRGRMAQPVYCMTKGALAIYLESLRNRLARKGVKVVTIKPGPVRTPMTEGLEGLPFMIDAKRAAGEIADSLEKGRTTSYVPMIWRPIMTIIRHVPSFIFRRTNV